MADVMSLFSPSLTVSPVSPSSSSGPPSLSIDEDDDKSEEESAISRRSLVSSRQEKSSTLPLHPDFPVPEPAEHIAKRSASYSPPRVIRNLKIAQLNRYPLPQVVRN